MSFSVEEVQERNRLTPGRQAWHTIEFSTRLIRLREGRGEGPSEEIFDEIAKWCKEIGFVGEYDLKHLDFGFVHFAESCDAILFKTTWC